MTLFVDDVMLLLGYTVPDKSVQAVHHMINLFMQSRETSTCSSSSSSSSSTSSSSSSSCLEEETKTRTRIDDLVRLFTTSTKRRDNNIIPVVVCTLLVHIDNLKIAYFHAGRRSVMMFLDRLRYIISLMNLHSMIRQSNSERIYLKNTSQLTCHTCTEHGQKGISADLIMMESTTVNALFEVIVPLLGIENTTVFFNLQTGGSEDTFQVLFDMRKVEHNQMITTIEDTIATLQTQTQTNTEVQSAMQLMTAWKDDYKKEERQRPTVKKRKMLEIPDGEPMFIDVPDKIKRACTTVSTALRQQMATIFNELPFMYPDASSCVIDYCL